MSVETYSRRYKWNCIENYTLPWQTNKSTFVNMFSHVLLFLTNTCPSLPCLITRIQLIYKSINVNSLAYHISLKYAVMHGYATYKSSCIANSCAGCTFYVYGRTKVDSSLHRSAHWYGQLVLTIGLFRDNARPSCSHYRIFKLVLLGVLFVTVRSVIIIIIIIIVCLSVCRSD